MHTHLEQWAADAVAPGEQSGVRCLAQGSHLSRGQFLLEPRFEPTTSGYKFNRALGHVHGCPRSNQLWFGVQKWAQIADNTLKNKGSSLALTVQRRTFNIHGTFPLNKRFLIEGTGSLDFLNVLYTKKKSGYFKSSSLKRTLGDQKWLFYCITAKTQFWNLSFFRVQIWFLIFSIKATFKDGLPLKFKSQIDSAAICLRWNGTIWLRPSEVIDGTSGPRLSSSYCHHS